MPPVVGAAIGAITAIASTIGAAFTAIAGISIGSITVGRILLQVGISLILNALFAPKHSSVQQRQANVLELSLGETPREAPVGRCATGGTLLNAWNDGSDNEFETVVIQLADIEIDALEGFFYEDAYYALTAQGAQTHADFQDGGPVLWIEWRLGAPGQTVCPIILNQGVAAEEWTAEEAPTSFVGIAYAVVRYKISDKVWKSGRPRWRFVVRGAKCYDPRLDDTVAGGAGPHRWGDPTTYTWTENARICHANFMWGFWNYAADPPQLIVGPGKSFDECPVATVISDANICDEAVALKAGGTEPRYRVGGVIAANERWIDVEEHFAAAMGGSLVERDGTIGVMVGAARSVEFEFTDDKLLRGQEMKFQAKVARDSLINTVIARFVDPSQLYEQASAPLRRSADDITADGQPLEETIDLVLVTSGTQAQRCAEIKRRKHRLQATAVVPLGPEYMLVEDGDWGSWTSERRFGGEARTFETHGVRLADNGQTYLVLKRIEASVFTWNAETDELDLLSPAYLPSGAAAAASVANFDAVPLEITSESGVSSSAILTTWTPPNDVTVTGIRLEYRPKGSAASTKIVVPPGLGEHVISVLPVVDVDYEVRATPEVSPRRDTLTTAWRDVLLSVPFNAPEPPLNFTAYQAGDLIRFTWTAYADTRLQYEIRAGDTYDLGRFVARVYGGATTVPWPIASDDDDLLFWIKTLHPSGVYSTQAALFVASPNDLTGRNFVLAEDFQAQGFPGVWHSVFDTDIAGLTVLELDAGEARGDYYASISLLDTFTARTWLEHRASAYVNDLPAWQDTENTWDDFGDDDWQPDIGDPGGDAALDAFIAINIDLPAALVEGWRFNGSLQGVRGTDPETATGTSYAPAKAAQGVTVATELSYSVTLGTQFSKLFDYRLASKPVADETIARLSNAAGQFLRFYWRASDEKFVLAGDFGAPVELSHAWQADDTISVGIWQSDTARGAGMASKADTTWKSGSALLV